MNTVESKKETKRVNPIDIIGLIRNDNREYLPSEFRSSWDISFLVEDVASSRYTRRIITIPEAVNIAKVIVANQCQINVEDISLQTRKREIVSGRMLTAYLLWYRKKNLGLSLSEIGSFVGGFDHATVLHYKKNILNLIEIYPKYREMVNTLLEIFFDRVPDSKLSWLNN